MFRAMRRKKQQMADAEALEILARHTSGVLAVAGDDGYPYAVPISYACEDGRLFFHSALEGHKIDGIRRSDRVSFSVIDQDEVVPQTFSTNYRSVTVFGRARILTDAAEKRHALEMIAQKYSPGLVEEGQREIAGAWERVCVVEIRIEHLTGKVAKALVD